MKAPSIEYFKKTLIDAYRFGLCGYEDEAGDGMIPAQYVLIENNLKFATSAAAAVNSSTCSVCVLMGEEALLVYSCGFDYIDLKDKQCTNFVPLGKEQAIELANMILRACKESEYID
jgi:hypothetical protein